MRRASKLLGLFGRPLIAPLMLWLLCAIPALAQERGWIGVELLDIAPERARELGLDESTGAYVTATRHGGSAERSGLAAGDVILDLDGQSIADTKAAVQAIQARPPGTSARVTVWRDKTKLTIVLAIGKAPEVFGLIQQIETLGRSGKHADVAALADKLEGLADTLPGLSLNERSQAYERVGAALQELSQYAKAEVFRRRVLEIRQAQHDAKHPTVATALSSR